MTDGAEQFENIYFCWTSSIYSLSKNNQSILLWCLETSIADYFISAHFDFEVKKIRQIDMTEHIEYRNDAPRSILKDYTLESCIVVTFTHGGTQISNTAK